MTDINQTLAERGNRYGRFADHAVIAQSIKKCMWGGPGWQRLVDDQKQALEVIADKIARILNGDPNYVDNWHDIIGYAKLVEDRLVGMQPAPDDEAPRPGETYEDWAARVAPLYDAILDDLGEDGLARLRGEKKGVIFIDDQMVPPAADEPQSQIVDQRSKIRKVIDDFWKNRSTVEHGS